MVEKKELFIKAIFMIKKTKTEQDNKDNKKICFQLNKKLHHFVLDVSCGFDYGVLVIEGESGSGKTTILNCISGIDKPDKGLVKINNNILYDTRNHINVPVRKRRLGYLFQNYGLFPHMTVYQNILYGIKNKCEYKNRTTRKELIEYVDYVIDSFGINHLKQKNPGKISGGEKQRVALCRAIVTKPTLLLLDEPFSALDKKTKRIIYDEFQNFKDQYKIPTILITHDPYESDRFADQKIVIQEGQIVQIA
jgi:molybdate transport system ATP-binding protein